ncbi:MAG TPA: hypothetical protein EYP64_02125 [Desulfarculaceae bacterium]|nr:hypothetical protein [Desulfarculaceae bacterium]
MPHSLFGKLIIWSLVIACFCSFGRGSSRAVICLEQSGDVSLEIMHNGSNGHCSGEHLHGCRTRRQLAQHKNQTSPILKHNHCSTCDDFEVSLQLFAPRNEPVNAVIKFIAKPQLPAGLQIQPERSSNTLSQPYPQPLMIDPSFTYLKSTILLI